MQFIVMKQIAVEAETPEEAVAKISEGNTIALSVSVRPQPVQGQSLGSVLSGGKTFQQTTTVPTPP